MRPIAGRESKITQTAVKLATLATGDLQRILARGCGADAITRAATRRVLRVRGESFTANRESPSSLRIVCVILKDENELDGQSVGPLYFRMSNGDWVQRPDLALPDHWYTETEAGKIASKLGVRVCLQ